MAGSHPEAAASPFSDPILNARVEAIRQLADGLSDRVAVMDRDFNVVYANQSARTAACQFSTAGLIKCYEAFAQQSAPCQNCPAIAVFDEPQAIRISEPEAEAVPCGMQQASPLMTGQAAVGLIVVLLGGHHSCQRIDRDGLAIEEGSNTSRESLGDLIGRSPVMQQLFDMIELIADSSATVLIQGESGTGKELVAKTIHRLSNRRHKPFVVVDCGALPEALLESELFGHVKGAFTGATRNKRGLFEEADGGTIFLDEIANTTPAFQAKLLRALQEGEIKRVGGNEPIKLHVRVISATNMDLAEMVKAKTFRQDLYYRLAVLPLLLPPLRSRKEDIPLLVEQFVAATCKRQRQAIRRVPDDVMSALSRADWHGNVRELQHYIERAVVTTSGPLLRVPAPSEVDSKRTEDDLRSVSRAAVKEAERTRIFQALEQAAGNRVKAAKLLRISRAGLYNKLKAYGIGETLPV